jgi:ribonuclease P protein component
MTEGKEGPRRTFPRSKRLRKRADFLRVQASGARVQTRSFVVLIAPGAGEGDCRLGIVASRKVGGAVERNRAKRLVREAFRRQAGLFPARVDVVIVVRPVIVGLSQEDVDTDLCRAAPAIRRSGRLHR